MNNNCINLRLRTKKGVKYCFCTHRKTVVSFEECKGCLNRKMKKASKIASKTRIKPISKRRVFVSKKTYEIVIDRSRDYYGVPHCQLCGAVDNLELHHVYYRSERKDLIDDPNNCLMLCHKDFSKNKCHRIVHSNKKKYQPLLLEILEKTEKTI